MATKKIKVKDIAKKFGLPDDLVIRELSGLGLEVSSPSSVINKDIVDVAVEHFENFAPDENGSESPATENAEDNAASREIHLKTPVVVKTLAETLGKPSNEVITALMKRNVLAGINQTIDSDTAVELCGDMGFTLILDKREKGDHLASEDEIDEISPEDMPLEDKSEDLKDRAPVVAFLGHVDHGKTSLQDAVRKTDVVAGESGGITQHIGASVVKHKGKTITFVDTPGHEAFTAMRARGANVTDIVVLVVAADDGFMPQTVEAMNHAKAAGVPIIVAINKMDVPAADPDKILRQMQENELMSEDWGGDVGVARVSALKGEGISELLDRILLESEMLELKANPDRPARGVVLEGQLEQGLGSTANIIVTTGTLRVGDSVICGSSCGRVKALINERNERVDSAGPSMPVRLVGLDSIPEAGARLAACENEKDIKRISSERGRIEREQKLSKPAAAKLEDLFKNLEQESRNDLNIILKTDVKGSAEAIRDSLGKLPSEKISVNIIHSGIGGITENDVLLASASGAIVVGFHVRVNSGVNALASSENVDIRLYSVIYELLEDIEDALSGRLAPEEREKQAGEARILQIFDVSKGPKVCGCMVEKGKVRVGLKARVFRNEELIYTGEVQSLRRFQDDVREVNQGLECGIRLDNFMDFEEGDRIEFFEIELRRATL